MGDPSIRRRLAVPRAVRRFLGRTPERTRTWVRDRLSPPQRPVTLHGTDLIGQVRRTSRDFTASNPDSTLDAELSALLAGAGSAAPEKTGLRSQPPRRRATSFRLRRAARTVNEAAVRRTAADRASGARPDETPQA